jgi:hypothetical protein
VNYNLIEISPGFRNSIYTLNIYNSAHLEAVQTPKNGVIIREEIGMSLLYEL